MNGRSTPLPNGVDQKHLEYLNKLRESAETNMFGASPYVAREFALSIYEARVIPKHWMDTFSERHPE